MGVNISSRSLDVIGLGEVCIDWILKVDGFPEVDGKIFFRESGRFPGGVTANFAVGMARLGGRVGFIGGVGRDEHGLMLLEALRREGVDVEYVKIHEDKSTAVNFIAVNHEGEKMIFMDPALKNNVPDPDYIDGGVEQYILSAKALHTSAIKIETAVKAAGIARKGGLTVSFDLEKHVVNDYGLEGLKPMLELTNILMPNKLGIKTLTGRENLLEAARDALRYGPEIVVITRGDKGSMIVTDSRVIETPAFSIEPVDTTGAGDAFNAAFIYSYVVKGLSLREASIVANAAAALKCLKLGAQTGLPRIDELRSFLRKHGYRIEL